MCADFDLCTPCYYSGEHSLDHAFSRIDCREDGHRYVALCIDELSCSPMGVETNLLEH